MIKLNMREIDMGNFSTLGKLNGLSNDKCNHTLTDVKYTVMQS